MTGGVYFAHVVAVPIIGCGGFAERGACAAACVLHAGPDGDTIRNGVLQGDDWRLHGAQYVSRMLPDSGAHGCGADGKNDSPCYAAFGDRAHYH